jgi:hypothetical protein
VITKALDIAGFRLQDAVYDPAQQIRPHRSPWAGLCLAVEGGYAVDWGRMRMGFGPGSLVFRPPNDAYGAGSRRRAVTASR